MAKRIKKAEENLRDEKRALKEHVLNLESLAVEQVTC